ncbi:hypothetical protein BD410DRAFT_780115 [Rickenella mellea]|uniref:tRNA (guanine(9)-N1)-methyltransferase n=1 Tax=Rickenella mellea TaxID=50990 RepID=A0A4R5XF07_9AGAM|nr:hypothetical protein BD410DRAFT_780115 [Rickenella mellea]
MSEDAPGPSQNAPNVVPDPPVEPPLSKNAQKRQLKAERIAAQKVERRAREKAAKKEKAKIRAEKRAAGEEVDELQAPKPKKPRISGPDAKFGARIVVDLGFDDKMSDREIISLCSQLGYTYNSHRKAVQPFSSLLFTSLNGRTFTRLEGQSNAAYKRWAGTEWWTEGYERLWDRHQDNSVESTVMTCSERDMVVYLTADAEEELEELKTGDTYIIGGICDHNRYKNLCLNKAKAHKIRSARLPIGKYLANLPTRKVLTVNQVFDILVTWVETRDWEKALYAVMPKRKFQEGGKKVAGESRSDDGLREEQEQVGRSTEPEQLEGGDRTFGEMA